MGNSNSSASSSAAAATTASAPSPTTVLLPEFSIAGQKLKLDTAADVAEYVKQLNKAKGLEVVNLSGNTLGLEACKAIAAALEPHQTLKEVNISDCFTGRLKEDVPPAIEAFGKALADKPNLGMVDFSDNAFSPAGAKALSFFLANCVSLQELRLNNNGLGPDGGKIIAEGLLQNRAKSHAAGKPSALRRVTIGRNRLENGSAGHLAEAFKAHELLEEVALYQNGIRMEGIVALSTGLSACHALKAIDLQDNTFSKEGSAAFAKAIPSWPVLERLNVGDCLVGDVGSRAILESLISCPSASTLRVLNLQFAEMKSKTAFFLAANLKAFPALESLLLNGNCFAPEGAEVKAINEALTGAGKAGILDELEDMDYDSEEEESEIESEIEESEVEEVSESVAVEAVTEQVEQVQLEETKAEQVQPEEPQVEEPKATEDAQIEAEPVQAEDAQVDAEPVQDEDAQVDSEPVQAEDAHVEEVTQVIEDLKIEESSEQMEEENAN